MAKVWFITGSSKGLGRAFALAALERGDRVAATARDVRALSDLQDRFGDRVLALELDVTDRAAAFRAAAAAKEGFGRIDVVVNDAGYGLYGTVEEITPQQLRDQLEVNLFGVLNVTQAVLPVLREQRGGLLVQISSIGGLTAYPTGGGYHASKWAVEGLSQSLAQEVAPFGIRVVLVEPGSYATDYHGSSARHADEMPEYDAARATVAQIFAHGGPHADADPADAAQEMLRIVDAEELPLRVFLGQLPFRRIPAEYQQRLADWERWRWLAEIGG